MTYPQAPQMPFAPQTAPPRPAKFGALAWAALILGIVGIVGSPIIFLNNLTAVVAAVGLVLGIIAVFGTKKVVATIGVLLCVGGIAFTVAAQSKTVEELDKVLNGTANQGQVSEGGSDQPAVAAKEEPAAEAPTWGKRYTWSSGLAVEIAPPVACQPGQYANPQDIQRAAKFTVTIINGTPKPFETAVLSFGGDAQFNGKKAETIFDSSGECGGGGMESATVMPGKTYTYEVSYAVEAQPGEMQIALQANFGADKAVFTGQA